MTLNGIYDAIDDINQNVAFGDLKDTASKNGVRRIKLIVSGQGGQVGFSRRNWTCKGAEKANCDAIQEEVTRSTTKENELMAVLIHFLAKSVDAKEKGLW